MFIAIGLIVMGSCFCMYCAYHTWVEAKFYNAQAEQYLRAANERLFEADKIEQRTKRNNNKQIGQGAKILPFNRHLKSIPPEPENDGPNAA